MKTITKVILRPSSRSDKKFSAELFTDYDRVGMIHFGANGYSDYPTHKDDKRKKSYIARHKPREDWTVSGIDTAGFWARWLLWNKPTYTQSIRDIENRFNVRITFRRKPK